VSRLDTRIARDLREIADRATPSPTAWETIHARMRTQAPVEETEVIMLTDEPTGTRRGWMVLVAAAAAVVIAVVIGVLVTRNDDPKVTADEGASPEEVLDEFVVAYNAKDLDAVMALFADSAVVTGEPLDRDPPMEGIDEIRDVYARDMEQMESIELTDLETAGHAATFVHIWRSAGGACYAGTNRVVVEGGEIIRWDVLTHSRPCPNT
jgi:hypothetical protein